MASAHQETEARPITRYVVMEAIPIGKRAYIMAGLLLLPTVVQPDSWRPVRSEVDPSQLRDAVGLLARAHARDELVPPMPTPLADVLTQISDTIEAEENKTRYENRTKEQIHTVGVMALRASPDLYESALLATRAAVYLGGANQVEA